MAKKATKSAAKKASKPKASKPKAKRKPNPALMKPVQPDAILGVVVGLCAVEATRAAVLTWGRHYERDAVAADGE